jgi:hypothetical protein
MKNYTHKLFGKLGTWLMILLFISAAPFAKAQETPDMVIQEFLDASDATITSAYPGDIIKVVVNGNINFDFTTTITRYALVNQEYINTQGQSGLNFAISAVTVTDEITHNEVIITATVPHNISTADYALHNLKVLCVTAGTSIDFGEFAISNLNVIDNYSEDDLSLTGGNRYWNGSNFYLNFSLAGARHFTTPEFNVHTATNSTLSYEIRRTSTAVPPAGSEIYFEYSTDGETWVKFDTIYLDMGTTWPASAIEHDVTTAMVSANTQFRFRQKYAAYTANNHTWEIRNFIIHVPASDNNFNESTVENFTIITPNYSIELTNPGASPFEIGTNVGVTITNVNGKFPDGTKFEKYLYSNTTTPFDRSQFGVLSSAPTEDQTFSITAPFILGNNLQIYLRAENAEGYIHSDWTSTFTTQTVNIGIDAIEFTEPIEEAGGEATSPGKEISVDYTINGEFSTPNIDVVLEYQMGGNWYPLTSQAAEASTSGTITGTLPFMELATTLPIRIRLTNTDNIGYQNQTIARNNTDYEVGPYTVEEGSRFGFQIYGEVHESQNVTIEYSVDNGTTWEVMATKAVTAGFEGFIFHYAVDLFDIPVTGDVMFRPAQSGEEGTIDAEIIGHRLEKPLVFPNVSDQDNISIINPSLTVGDIYVVNEEAIAENGYFEYETEYTLEYATRGLWPADTYFTFVFERNNRYIVLAESNLQGEQSVTFTVPSKDELAEHFGVTLGSNENFTIKGYAYSRNEEFGGYQNLRLYLQSQYIYRNDLLERSGTSGNNMYFNQNNERYSITRAYDLSNMVEPVKLQFYYQSDIGTATLNTLPKVQISIDNGVTYTDLEINEDSDLWGGILTYHSLNRLEKTGGWYRYSLDIPSQFLTEETHFRWIQTINSGWWEIYNYDSGSSPVITGNNNEIPFYDKLPASQTMNFVIDAITCTDYDDSYDDYTWRLVDEDLDPLLDPAAVAGEEFTFAFEYNSGGAIEPSFPLGTDFYFELNTTGSVAILDPETGESIVWGPYENVNDTIGATLTMPEFIETGIYHIVAYAQFENEETSCNWVATVKTDLFIEGIQAQDAISLMLNTPENGDTYKINEQLTVDYSSYGEWPTDIKFAAVVKATIDSDGNTKYVVLDEATATGLNNLIENVKMIDAPWWYEDLVTPANSDYITNYSFGIVAYQGAELILQNNVYGPLTIDDFIEFKGATDLGNWIDDEGDRYFLSNAFDLTGLINATLEFRYSADNITISSSTLPQLLVSIDGGTTFSPLAVEGEYGDVGYLGSNETNKTYSVEIPAEFLTSATHFMWKQQVNGGQGNDEWRISNINVTTGSSNVYEGMQSYANFTLTWPRLSNYTLSLVEVDGMEPTLFNGSTFDFNWELNVDPITEEPLDALPAGTVVEFYLWESGDFVIDPETEVPILLGTANAVGEFEGSIPFLTERDNYDVRAIALLNDEVYDEATVKTISVFNDVIRTTLVETNPVIFAGNTIEVEGTIENTTNVSNYNDVWFNLVMADGANEILLDAKQGLNENFIVDLPPSIAGTLPYAIIATADNPLGTVGEPISMGGGNTLDNSDMNGVYSAYNFGDNSFTLDFLGAMQQIYTNGSNNNWDLTNQTVLQFKLKFEKEIAELTDDQKLVLTYSVDGGVTFTEMASYPDARFNDPLFFDNEDLDDWFNEQIQIPEEAKTEETILRWRVEESKGYAMVKDIELLPFADFHMVPLQFIVNNLTITPQRIDLVANDLTVCPDGSIEFTYNIRGRFSEMCEFTINSTAGTPQINNKDVKFTGITEGTGEITLNLGLLDNPISGTNVQFILNASDLNYNDNPYTILGNWSELGVEIIPNIEDFMPGISAQTLGNDDYYSCTDEERVVVVNNIKEYFAYQLRNVISGELIGDAVFVDTEDEDLMDADSYPYYNPGADGGNGTLEISIGAISGRTVVEVMVTSHNAGSDLTCQNLVVNDQAIFNTRDLVIQYTWSGSDLGSGYWKEVTGNENFAICEGSTDLSIRLYDYTEEAPVVGDIMWYRNNTETPISGGTLTNYPVTGDYFVVYKHSKCDDYVSDPITITVVERPEKPIITFEGSQELCEGEYATLSTSDSYSYYRWYNVGDGLSLIPGMNSNTLEVYYSGDYVVEVSNVPFDPNVPICSEFSDNFVVDLNIHYRPSTPNNFNIIEDVLCEPGAAQVELYFVEDDVWYQLFDWKTNEAISEAQLGGNQNSLILTTDVLTERTEIGVMAWRNGVETCAPVYSTNYERVIVYDLYIDVNGNTLIASIPYDRVDSYQWYRNDRLITNGGTSRTLNIYDDATYKVVVVTYDGCVLESSVGREGEPEPEDQSVATSLSLFPNPATDNINISYTSANDESVRIRILNLSGEVVFEKEVEKVNTELKYVIPVRKLNNGAYIIHVIGKQDVKVQQFIKF